MVLLLRVTVHVWLGKYLASDINHCDYCVQYIVCRLAEGCSHAAAILFKVECAVRLGYTSVTSQACRWNDVYCKKVRAFSL